MSFKTLFDKAQKVNSLSNKSAKEIGGEVESVGYHKEDIINEKRYIPGVDFSDPATFARYGSAEEYYIQWIETKKQNLLDEIEEYNKQDCVSTFKLRNWLLKIKPADTKWFVPEKEQMELRPFEENLLDYQKRFNASKLSDNPIVKLLSDVIGFYNREQKPQWRQFFDRKDLSDEELIDDRECIGNMKLVSQVQDKKSFCYKYLFPEQEYKLKKGRGVIIANNNDPDRYSTDHIQTI